MKLGTCLYQDTQQIFIHTGDQLILPAQGSNDFDLAWYDLELVIEQYDDVKAELEKLATAPHPDMLVPADDVTLLAPIPHPRKNVMCLGLNYLEHAEETAAHVGRSAKAPEHPIVFTKATSSITAHHAVIPYDPETCSQLDWEAELGIIIGKTGRKISREHAMEYIFGYTVINDLSARDLQFNHKQFFLGKSIDGGCPIGPHIVTADEIADPQALSIECRVNEVVKQRSNTQHMIFDIPTIIEQLSRGMTLHAGDIIATGTPSGVGFARDPQEFLKPGDVVECEVESVGVLRNLIGSIE